MKTAKQTVHEAAAERDQLLLDIARKHLNLKTLESRNSDCYDFHDIGVWSLKAALEAAYQAGRADGAVQAKVEA